MKTPDVEIEKICINCHSSFPAESNFSQTWICLADPVFEPFVDDLIERNDYSKCQNIVKTKQFPDNQEACDKFDPVEPEDVCEIDKELGERLFELSEQGGLNDDSFIIEVLNNQLKKMGQSDYPLEPYIKLLYSTNNDETLRGFEQISAAISQGNKPAIKVIMDYYKQLPPAITLVEVNWKLFVINKLNISFDKKELFACVVNELYKTESNNTTRQLISRLFKIMENK